MGKNVTLHEEIRDILESQGNQWMTTSDLASRVNVRGRYRKRDGSAVSRFQIHGRTRNNSHLFERNGSRVRVIPEQAVVASLGDPRGLNSVPALRRLGFEGFLTVKGLRHTKRSALPAEPGVYLFLRTLAAAPEFLIEGTGGRFKNKDPNVPIDRLLREWVEGALIVYVGQTGSRSRGTLARRVHQMIRFGQGARVGHWGGRLIWQLEDSDRLVVCWKTITGRDPRDVERALIESFKTMHGGKRPFANLV